MCVRFLICFTVTSIFFSCKYQRKQEIAPIYRCTWNSLIENRLPKDIIYVPLKAFEVKENLYLYAILDTIIEATKKCQKYNAAGIEFVFMVSASDNGTEIRIENININCFELTNCDGFFSYKGYSFYYVGVILTDFFEKKEETIYKRQVKRMKVKGKIIEYVIDDPGSYWILNYENGNLKTMDFDNCGNRWIDENTL